ncbi:MAG TPA: serine/threonine-protein kinase, partial [Urbifossiella sp.]|nr:serine/threonine-protein kinase [Urbifossiella sp.]
TLPLVPPPSEIDLPEDWHTFGGATYHLSRRVGEGGMGVVYEARSPAVSEPVALKLIRGTPDDIALARFAREAELPQRFNGHPHVVRVLDVGRFDNGHRYIAFEYLGGGSLAAHAAEFRAPAAAAALLTQVATAVGDLHEKGVRHRDLKPDNLLFRTLPPDPAGVVVTDFGQAWGGQQVNRPTGDGQPLGTPTYAAPELLRDAAAADQRADIYSLGAILFRLLTGVVPTEVTWPNSLTDDYKTARAAEPPPPSRRFPPDVPAHLVSACRGCLHPHPDGRFPTAREFLRALTQHS